jgi:hypothetical protein
MENKSLYSNPPAGAPLALLPIVAAEALVLPHVGETTVRLRSGREVVTEDEVLLRQDREHVRPLARIMRLQLYAERKYLLDLKEKWQGKNFPVQLLRLEALRPSPSPMS